MNISAWTIYLWQLADNLIEAAVGLSIVFGVLTLILAFIFFAVRIEKVNDPSILKLSKVSLVVFFLLFLSLCFFRVFIPSSKTVAMMVVVPEIVNSKIIQQDLPDIYNVAVEALKASIKK